jgi:hypothetical protein
LPKSPIVDIEPLAVRPKVGARLAGCGLTEFYKRLNEGLYESFLDGSARLVIVESIRAHQQRQLEASRGTPREKPSRRGGGPGRPQKTIKADWQRRFRQEWVSADRAERERLLTLYRDKIDGLPRHELEKLLADLRDSC